MPLHLSCPHCGNETLVADEYAGMTGPCAICGKLITVPYFESPTQSFQLAATATAAGNARPLGQALADARRDDTTPPESSEPPIRFAANVSATSHAPELPHVSTGGGDTGSDRRDGSIGEAGPADRYPSTDHISGATEHSMPAPRSSRFGRIGGRWWVVASLAIAALSALGGAVALLTLVVFPVISRASLAAGRTQAADNIARLAIALNAYADEHGTYPPAMLRDENGKPMHSWRVLILPHLGYTSLHSKYDMSKPWDSPENIALLSEMPDEFSSPGNAGSALAGFTSFVVVRGEATAFPGRGALRPADIADGAPNTVLVVEVAESNIEWLKPSDLSLGDLPMVINNASRSISSPYPGGAHVATADGAAHFLPNDTLSEDIEAILTVDRNESVDWNRIER